MKYRVKKKQLSRLMAATAHYFSYSDGTCEFHPAKKPLTGKAAQRLVSEHYRTLGKIGDGWRYAAIPKLLPDAQYIIIAERQYIDWQARLRIVPAAFNKCWPEGISRIKGSPFLPATPPEGMKPVYSINIEVVKLGMMKHIPTMTPPAWEEEEEAHTPDPDNAWLADEEDWIDWDNEKIEEAERVRVKAWIDSTPEISVTVEGELRDNQGERIRLDDGTDVLVREMLIDKAKEAGVDGEFFCGYNLLPLVTSHELAWRGQNGIRSGWVTMYVFIADWNILQPFSSVEEAGKWGFAPDQIRKIRCRFNDEHICTVVEWED